MNHLDIQNFKCSRVSEIKEFFFTKLIKLMSVGANVRSTFTKIQKHKYFV